MLDDFDFMVCFFLLFSYVIVVLIFYYALFFYILLLLFVFALELYHLTILKPIGAALLVVLRDDSWLDLSSCNFNIIIIIDTTTLPILKQVLHKNTYA